MYASIFCSSLFFLGLIQLSFMADWIHQSLKLLMEDCKAVA
jgi:hypothetical protein